MRTDFSDYKFRASWIGKIMAGVPKPLTKNQAETYDNWLPRSQGEGKPLSVKQIQTLGSIIERKNAKAHLTDGAKNELKRLHWELVHGRTSEIETKYMDKGIQAEEQGISLYTEYTGRLYVKNSQRAFNDHFTGECDINPGTEIIPDIKCSWDSDTFPATETSVTNKIYIDQGNVYCDLYDKQGFEIVYCLVDTPHQLIDDELRRLDWKFGLTDHLGNYYDRHIPFIVEKLKKHIYSAKGLEEYCQQSSTIQIEWFDSFVEIPLSNRIKIFPFERDDQRLEYARTMVELAREYMNKLSVDMADKIKA